MLPAWNVTLAEAAAGRSASIVTDVAVTAAKRATVRITDTLLRLRSLGNQTELEQPSRTPRRAMLSQGFKQQRPERPWIDGSRSNHMFLRCCHTGGVMAKPEV